MGSSKSLLVSDGEVQPGFLALQTLGHIVKNGVVPEANDWDAGSLDQPLSQELGSTCCDPVPLQALQWTVAGQEGNRGKRRLEAGEGVFLLHVLSQARQSHLSPLLPALSRGL